MGTLDGKKLCKCYNEDGISIEIFFIFFYNINIGETKTKMEMEMEIKVREIEKMIGSDFIVLVKPDNTVVATNNKIVADSADLEDMHNDNWLDYEVVRIESCCFTHADHFGNEVTKIGVCLVINEINPETWMDNSVSNVWSLIGRENNVRIMDNDTELVCGKKKDGYSSFGLRTVGRIFASEDFNNGEHGLVLYLESE